MQTSSLVLLLAAAAVVGCAGRHYAEPESSVPSASLSMVWSGEGSTSYIAFDNAQCTRTASNGMLAMLSGLGAGTKSARVRSGSRVYVHVGTNRLNRIVGDDQDRTLCDTLFSFVPEQNHQYRAQHILNSESCSINLVDAATGAQPESFQTHTVPSGCGG